MTHQSVMVQMPTGTGKTMLLAEVVKSEKLKVKNPCVWIVVHRRELVEQIKETLNASLNATHNVECEMLNVKRGKQLDSSLFPLHLPLFVLHLNLVFSRFNGSRSTIMNWRRNLRSS